MTPENNGTQRITPEQKLGRDVNQLFMAYLATGGNSEFLMGLCDSMKTFIEAPQKLNAMRQAEQMLVARSQTQKTQSDEPNPRLSA